jgi:hypothetical protein
MSEQNRPSHVYIVSDSDGDPDDPIGIWYDREKAVRFAKKCVADWKDPDEYEDLTAQCPGLEYCARYDCEDHTVAVNKCKVNHE